MATITIQRTRELNNMIRDFKIFIDGKQVGTIANGKTKEFTTTPGQHTITSKIGWCSSPDISISITDNETKKLKVGGFKYAKWVMFIGMEIICMHLILSLTRGFNYTIFLIVPILLLMAYYLTFGAKKYLTLKEIKENKLPRRISGGSHGKLFLFRSREARNYTQRD